MDGWFLRKSVILYVRETGVCSGPGSRVQRPCSRSHSRMMRMNAVIAMMNAPMMNILPTRLKYRDVDPS